MQPLTPLKAHVIDAQTLDEDLLRMLQGMWKDVCAQAGAKFSTTLQPEIEGALRAVLWYLSMWRGSASLGQQMQNMHCVAANSPLVPEALQQRGAALELPDPSLKANAVPSAVVPRNRRLLFGLLTVLLPWAWSRASRAMASPEHPERLRWWRLMRRLEGALQAASIACSLYFLVDGRYPTLPMALLRLRLAYTRPNAPRLPEFDLMNQQLAWQHITDTISSARALFAPVTAAAPPHAAAGSAGWLDWLLRALRVRAAARLPPAHACGFCAAAPMHTPQRAPCGHVFCYYCLASACAASGRPRCPRCAARLELGERCPAALIPRPPPAPAGGEEAATAWPTPTTQETGQAQGG